MIFQKRGKKGIESIFHIEHEPVEIAQNYTYLGTSISSTGNFSYALDQKRPFTPFSVLESTNFSKLPAFIANKLFDTMIIAILLNNLSHVARSSSRW